MSRGFLPIAGAESSVGPTGDGLHGWRAPITATSDAWAITIFALLSCGIAPLLLGLYLGIWLYKLSGEKVSAILYAIIAPCTVLALIPLTLFRHAISSDYFATGISLLWVISGVVLRAEITCYYKRTFGMQLELSRWKTLFFSVLHLNWCLAVYRP